MKIVIIHGQSHKGSTYHIARILAEIIGGEISEFFLPRLRLSRNGSYEGVFRSLRLQVDGSPS